MHGQSAVRGSIGSQGGQSAVKGSMGSQGANRQSAAQSVVRRSIGSRKEIASARGGGGQVASCSFWRNYIHTCKLRTEENEAFINGAPTELQTEPPRNPHRAPNGASTKRPRSSERRKMKTPLTEPPRSSERSLHETSTELRTEHPRSFNGAPNGAK